MLQEMPKIKLTGFHGYLVIASNLTFLLCWIRRIIVPSVINVNMRVIQQWHWLPLVASDLSWFPVVILVSSGYLGFQWLSFVSSGYCW